eukprot:4594743-Lingulodinium_polyedra.AAC.1
MDGMCWSVSARVYLVGVTSSDSSCTAHIIGTSSNSCGCLIARRGVRSRQARDSVACVQPAGASI